MSIATITPAPSPPTSRLDGTLVRHRNAAATSHPAAKTTTVASRQMRVAVISDIHANEEALGVVLEEIAAWGPDALWCLGDLVGYGPAPHRCCALVSERADVSLVGYYGPGALGALDVRDCNEEGPPGRP